MYTNNADEKQEQKSSSSEESEGEDLLLNISERSIETSFIEDKPMEFKNQYFDRRAPSPISKRNQPELSNKIPSNDKPISPSNQIEEQRNSGGKVLIQNRIKAEVEEQQQAETRPSVKDLITKFGKKETKPEPPKNTQNSNVQGATNDEKRGSVKDLIKRFEKPKQDTPQPENEKERLSTGEKGGLISNRIQELQKKIEISQKEKQEQENWEKQKEERLQQLAREKEMRATFMVSNEQMDHGKLETEIEHDEKFENNAQTQNEEQPGNERQSDHDVKSHLLDDDDDEEEDNSESLSKSNSENNSRNVSADKIRVPNPFGFQITASTETEDQQARIDVRPTASFDNLQTRTQAKELKEVPDSQIENPEKFSLMPTITHPHQNQLPEDRTIQTSPEQEEKDNSVVEQVFNPFAGATNPFTNDAILSDGNYNSEEDLARASANFGFFQGNKNLPKQDIHSNEPKGEGPSQILEDEEDKNDRSDNSIVLNREAQGRWRFKMDSNQDFPVEGVEGNLLDLSHALSNRTDNTQDYSRLGVPTFKNKLYEGDRDNSFYLNMSRLNDNSMISQIGDSSMIKGNNSFIKNKSQILEGEIKLIDLDISGVEQDTSFTNLKSSHVLPKPTLTGDSDSNVVKKAQKVKEETKKQANMNDSNVFSKIDKIFEEGKGLDDLNESKKQLLEDLDRSRNKIVTTEEAAGIEELDRSLTVPEKQKKLEFFGKLLDISQIHQNEPENEGTQRTKLLSPTHDRSLFKDDHSHSSDDDANKSVEKPVLSSTHLRQSKLRNPDLLNVSTNEGTAKTKKVSDRLDTTAPLNESVDIEELKKGVPEYKPKQEVEPDEDLSARKSKLRSPDAMNVSTIEVKSKETEEDRHNVSASFEASNKIVDVEELRKGVPEYKPKPTTELVEEDVSSRKSKLRNPDALDVSAIITTTKEAEADQDRHNLSVSFEASNKVVDVEELKKGVPEYKPNQRVEPEEDISSRKSKLRNPEAMNVSAIEIKNQGTETKEDKHNVSASFEGVNKIIDIDELKKGVPEYKPKQKDEPNEDVSARKSKLRNPDALDVSAIITTTKELGGDEDRHNVSASFDVSNKVVDVEELKKGVPEYKSKQQTEQEEDVSSRKSKLRNPDALDVSAIITTTKEAEADQDRHNLSVSFEASNKVVDVEELKKGVPEYKPTQRVEPEEDISSRKSKLRNPDALNVSAMQITNKRGDGGSETEDDKHNVSASFDGLNKIIDIDELKKGVPEYKLKQKVEPEEDVSSRKSKLRNPEALNVSAIEIKNTEEVAAAQDKHNVSASFEGLNKIIDIEELKKGILEDKHQQQTDLIEDSKRKSKLRSPDALNVSTAENAASTNSDQNKLNVSTPLNPFDKMIEIEDLKKEFSSSVLPKDLHTENLIQHDQQIDSKNETNNPSESAEIVGDQKKRAFETKEEAQNFVESLAKRDLPSDSLGMLNKSFDFKSDSKHQPEDPLNKSVGVFQYSSNELPHSHGDEVGHAEEEKKTAKSFADTPQELTEEEQQQIEPSAQTDDREVKIQKKRSTVAELRNPFSTPKELKVVRTSNKRVAIRFCKDAEGITKYTLRGHGRFMFNQSVAAENIDSIACKEFAVTTSKRIIVPVYTVKDNKTKSGRRRKILGFTIKSDVMFRTRKEKRINKQFFCSNCEEFVPLVDANTHLLNCNAKDAALREFSEEPSQPSFEKDASHRISSIINKISELLTEYNVRPQFMTICKRIGEMCLPATEKDIPLSKLNGVLEQFDAVFNSLTELELEEDEIDMLIYLQRLFVILQEKAESMKINEEFSQKEPMQFNSPIFNELQSKKLHQKNLLQSHAKREKPLRLAAIDSDIASSVDSEMTFVSSESNNWVEYEPRANSKEKESNRRHFYTQAVNIKLSLPANHPAREIAISRLYEKSVKEKIPKENWINFIKAEFQVN